MTANTAPKAAIPTPRAPTFTPSLATLKAVVASRILLALKALPAAPVIPTIFKDSLLNWVSVILGYIGTKHSHTHVVWALQCFKRLQLSSPSEQNMKTLKVEKNQDIYFRTKYILYLLDLFLNGKIGQNMLTPQILAVEANITEHIFLRQAKPQNFRCSL